MSVRAADKTKPYFPLAGSAEDGYSNECKATATCYCGAVQIEFPVGGPGLVNTFICHCTDCRKITASMFASNFVIADEYLKHLRGRENLKVYGQSATIESGKRMTNYFCSTCGSLMYRVGARFPGTRILRIGTVDDFNLAEMALKPRIEQYVKDRVGWLGCAEGVKQVEGMMAVRGERDGGDRGECRTGITNEEELGGVAAPDARRGKL